MILEKVVGFKTSKEENTQIGQKLAVAKSRVGFYVLWVGALYSVPQRLLELMGTLHRKSPLITSDSLGPHVDYDHNSY